MNHSCDVGHHRKAELGGEDAGVLALVLLEDVGLHGAADVAQTRAGIAACSSAFGSRSCSARKASSCWSMAVLRNMARMVGAGPLMVIDTEVVGAHRSKPA